MGPFVVGSKNPDKVAEMAVILRQAGIAIVEGDWPDVDETGATLEENARLKAHAVAAVTGRPAISDDTGLEVDALDGRPGVHTARFAGPDAGYAENRAALLAALEGVAARSARFRTVVVAAWSDGAEIVVEGSLEGEIAAQERGGAGFGYDPVFLLPDGRTLAEVPAEEKNAMSHRGRALAALVEALSAGEAHARR
jgi:XTP/dITP diphosphohydrolase